MSASARRIIVDWGTSSFRAWLFGADGDLIDSRRAAMGILAVADGRFEEALRTAIGPGSAAAPRCFSQA